VRPDAVRDAIGLPMNDANLGVVDAERIGADLRHHRLETLAERSAAGDDFNLTRGRDGDSHSVLRAEPALLDEHGKPRADRLTRTPALRETCGEPVPADAVERLRQQSRVVAGVEHDLVAE